MLCIGVSFGNCWFSWGGGIISYFSFQVWLPLRVYIILYLYVIVLLISRMNLHKFFRIFILLLQRSSLYLIIFGRFVNFDGINFWRDSWRRGQINRKWNSSPNVLQVVQCLSLYSSFLYLPVSNRSL